MSKITLGKRPKSFAAKTVSVKLPDGTMGEIKVVYKYRTRKEFGEFVDAMFKEAGIEPEGKTEEEVKFSLASALSKATDSNADYILQIVESWDLEEAFSRSAVAQLCNELPGAAMALIDTYRQACVEGRLGN